MAPDFPELKMPLEDAMLTQRAIRRLTEEPVDDLLLLRLLELALKAPSGSNAQNWHFVVVRDRALMAELGKLNRSAWAVYGRIARFVARNNEDQQRSIRAVQWQVDHFDRIPVVVVACLRGGILMPTHFAATSYYGSIYPLSLIHI